MTYDKIIDSLEKELKKERKAKAKAEKELARLRKVATDFREAVFDRVCEEEDYVDLEFAPDDETKAINKARERMWKIDTRLKKELGTTAIVNA